MRLECKGSSPNVSGQIIAILCRTSIEFVTVNNDPVSTLENSIRNCVSSIIIHIFKNKEW